MDPLDYQDAALQLDLAFGISPETTASSAPPERVGQSAGRSGHDVVKGGGMRRAGIGRHPVVFGHLAVNAERDPAGLGRQRRPA